MTFILQLCWIYWWVLIVFFFADVFRIFYTLYQESSSNGVCVCVFVLSCDRLFANPWTVAHQVPLSMGFSRQEYWNGLPFPSPGQVMTSSVQSFSRVRLLATPWIAAHQASLSITNSRSSPKLMSIKLVITIQPSHPLSSPSPPASNPSQHQGLFQWVNSSHEVAKGLELQL